MKNYFNEKGDQLYTLHLPGNSALEEFEKLREDNKERVFTVSDNLTIISIMTKDFWDNSLLRQQCEYNNIKILNPGINEENWTNPLKIHYILEALNQVKTEYAIVLDGGDVCICNNLDDTLLEKIDKNKVTYNGDPFQFPKVDIEGRKYIKNLDRNITNKFLNAGVCIGKVPLLKKIYTHANEKRKVFLDNPSEQYFIRRVFKQRPELFQIDYYEELFGIMHNPTKYFYENDSKVILRVARKEENYV